MTLERMVEVDYCVPDLTLAHPKLLDCKEFYRVMKRWLTERGYYFLEKEYHDDTKDTGRELMIKWRAERKVDDYTQYVIEIKLVGARLEEVKSEAHLLFQGDISIHFEAYIETDYENRWEQTPLLKVARGLFDKVIHRNKTVMCMKELNDEVYQLHHDMKIFLQQLTFS